MIKSSLFKHFTLLILTSLLIYNFVYTDYNPVYEIRKEQPNKVIYNYLKEKNPGLQFETISCLKYIRTNDDNSSILPAKSSVSLQLNKNSLKEIILAAKDNIEFEVPVSSSNNVTLQL